MTSSQYRTQRRQETQRFISFSIKGLKNSFWYTRLVSLKTLVVGVYWCEKSCRSQRPPWSQMGQSSGWFARMNPKTDWWASCTTAVLVGPASPSAHAALEEHCS